MLFKFVKRAVEDPEIAVSCMGAPSLQVGEVLERDFKQWDLLWQKLKDVAHAPWRKLDEQQHPAQRMERQLDHISLRRAARSFKVKTATGVDALSPSHFTWLSDILLHGWRA